MSKKKPIPTVQMNFKVDPDVFSKIWAEAKRIGMWPGEIVTRRIRHSYEVSPAFPTLPNQPK